jgi:hypothetical protein
MTLGGKDVAVHDLHRWGGRALPDGRLARAMIIFIHKPFETASGQPGITKAPVGVSNQG